MAVQATLEGMPRRLYAATPTRLLTWLDCPRLYRFRYVDRPPPPKGPPWAHNSVGASVHLALAGWWRLPPDRRTVAAAGDLLRSHWLTEGFRDAAQSAGAQATARVAVERYVAGLDPDAEPVGVERTVAVIHGGTALQGRVDRIDEAADGSLTVVDYKTGRYVPSEDDARTSLALAIYAAAASRVMRRPCSRVELHHVPTGTVAAWVHLPEALRRHLDRADDIAVECAAADAAAREGRTGDDVFPPRPSAACAWCDFRQHCPEGERAAPYREPWAGVSS